MTLTPKEQNLINFAHYLSTHPWLPFLFAVLAIWTIIWKGTALWKAAREGRKDWFILLLVVNTVGILEIVYIFFFSKKKAQKSK
jgi:hypothetical protein